MNKSHLIITIFCFSFSAPLFAYAGPGMGGGIIAAVVGVISAFFLALFGILYYPIKRAFNKRKNKSKLKEISREKDSLSQ